MGSLSRRAAKSENEVHVLVTGFGPFSQYTENPSTLVAQSLSSVLDPLTESGGRIHVHVRPTPVKVSYKYVREHVPPLLFSKSPNSGRSLEDAAGHTAGDDPNADSVGNDDEATDQEIQGHANYDIVLFLGVSSVSDYYLMETKAYREGYLNPDVDGDVLLDDSLWSDLGAPEILQTSFDVDAVLQIWKDTVHDADVRTSADAGRYLCEFIFYTGLVEYWKRDKEGQRPVTFLHVPQDRHVEGIRTGKEVTEALIRALVKVKISSTIPS